MSVFVDKDSRVIIQGFTGQHATFHAEEAMSFGTTGRGRRHARQGRHTHLGLPGVQQRRRGGRGDRARRLAASSCRRRWPPTRCWRRPKPASGRRHHRRRRARAGHGPDEAVPGRPVHPHHRAELPRHHHAGRVQGGHHAQPHLLEGPRRRRLALRHAELRGRLADDQARPGSVDVRRHRRRPGERHRLQDGPAGIRERRRDRRGRDDRRDRWPAGGRGRRLGTPST